MAADSGWNPVKSSGSSDPPEDLGRAHNALQRL
jgi:hypothetical protein